MVGPSRHPHHQVVEPRCQHVVHLIGHIVKGAPGGIDRHGHHRHLKAAPGQRPAEPLLGYQVRQPVGLLQLRLLLASIGARGTLALMPRQGQPLGHQQTTPVERPVAHLGVLAAPLVERAVEPADLVEERTPNPQVAARHDAEQVVVGRGQVVCAAHVELDPLGRRGTPPRHTSLNRPRRSQVGRCDAVKVHVASKPQRERPIGHMVPAGVGLNQARLGDHVTVQKDEYLAGGRRSSQVACPGKAEAVVHLGHHPDLKGRTRRHRYGRAGAVVGHHHLEQVTRVGLGRQGRKRERQLVLSLVAGDDHAHPQSGPPCTHVGHVERSPVVAGNGAGQPHLWAVEAPSHIHVAHQPTTWRARTAPVTTP